MKLTILALAILAALAESQCISSIPSCAQECLANAISAATTCSATDYACQCTTGNQNAIQSNATNCVLAACGQTEAINDVLPAASAFCSAINAGETCSSSSSSSGTGTGTSSAASSTTTSTSTVATTASTMSVTPGGPLSWATGISASSGSSGTATATSSGSSSASSSSSSTSSAGAAVAGPIGSLGILVIGALAVL